MLIVPQKCASLSKLWCIGGPFLVPLPEENCLWLRHHSGCNALFVLQKCCEIVGKVGSDCDPGCGFAELAGAEFELFRSGEALPDGKERVFGLGWHEQHEDMDVAIGCGERRQFPVLRVGKIGEDDHELRPFILRL